MPCYHPLDAYRFSKLALVALSSSKHGTKLDPSQIFFGDPPLHQASLYDTFKVSCKRCIGCRMERSRLWAARCVHEASLHKDNCFVTLTYDEQHLPRDGSVDNVAMQNFMKRLRKKFGEGIRFFGCGEYGSQFTRPHYHIIIFNFDFQDKYLWTKRLNNQCYRSPALEKIWPFGLSEIGDVTKRSAAYVARYVLKKVNGDAAEDHYKGLKPEFIQMSRNPGIGSAWLKKYHPDVYSYDQVVIDDKFICRPPEYYDRLYDIIDHDHMEEIKKNRREFAKSLEGHPDRSPRRLADREAVQVARSNRLVRGFEDVR